MEVILKRARYWEAIENAINRDKKHYIAMPMGRVSGKTKGTIDFSVQCMLEFPYTDIVVARSSYGSIGDSSYAEFESTIADMPEEIRKQFEMKKSPLRIERQNNSGNVYFIGAGGSNKDRTKGLHTKHKCKILIVEETQELKDKESYDQLLASIRRNLTDDAIIFVLYNPPAIEAHWINQQTKIWEKDKDWFVCHATWMDILPFLNDFDVKEILKCKYLEPDYYQYIYCGVPTGALGMVYAMFRKDIHLVPFTERQSSKLISDFRIVGVVIGCDGAVNKDSTAFVPMFVMSNGQMVAGKVFYHNPKTNGVKGSFPLVENEGLRWFKDLRHENNLDNPYSYFNSIPIIFVVDSAATELIQALKYYFGNRADVYAIKKGTILQMVDTVQSAIGKNVVAVYDYGGYYNYTLNKWVNDENILAYQIRSLVWNEKQTGYDPIVPNDVCDAFTYAVYYYYRQTENIIWLQDVVNRRKDYYLLKSN